MKTAKRLLLCFLVLSLLMSLCACAADEPAQSVSDVQAVVTEAPAASSEALPDLTTGTPWLASTVQGVVTEDTPVSLKDDFFLCVNKDSLLSYEIQPGYSTAGVLTTREIENDRDILSLFTDFQSEEHDATLAKTLYDLFLDWDSRNALGVQPLKDVTDAVEAIGSIEELNAYCTDVPFERQAFLPFGFSPAEDFADSSRYIMSVGPGPLVLGDSLEYRQQSSFGKLMQEAWGDYCLYFLDRLGYSEEEAAGKIENCLTFESMLAPYIFSSDESRDPDFIEKIYNVVSTDEFETVQGHIPLLQLMDFCGYERKDSLVLSEPRWLEALKEIYDDEHLTLIKDYMIIHTVIDFGEVLDKDCLIKSMECANTLSGAEGFVEDEQYAAWYTLNAMSWPVSRLYCERYFTAEDKQNVSDMVHNVLDAYADMLAEEDFISEETKRNAVEKLDAMLLNVLYPDDWTQFSFEELDFVPASQGGTLFDALLALNRHNDKVSVGLFSKSVQKDLWDGLMPTEINAFYDPTANSVNILAAFCRGELYNSAMPIEEQYAKVGTVIAHEISHSFDGTGSRFDKDGNFAEWWTAEDRAAFAEKIKAIAAYADTVYCWDGVHINGSIVTGETCADMGALACILHIAESMEDFDYDLFFRSYAQMWSRIRSYNDFLSQLKNEHPPEYFRVNAVLQQFEEFYDCYGIEEGDGMYLAPEKRIAIW